MTKFKQVIYDRFDMEDPHSVHKVTESSLPDTLSHDRILVHMSCAPVHPCDSLCAMGIVNRVELPTVGGTEGVGVIEEVGAALKDGWQVGQRVHVAANYIFGEWTTWKGVWSEYVVCPDNALVAVPDGIDDDTAAQFFVNPFAAFAMVKEFGLGEGNILLQTAAGSVVGQLMIQLSNIYGFDTINLVRRQETADELEQEFGITSVYVFDGSDASKAEVKLAIARDFPGRNIDYCIEAVGGDTAHFCLDLLGPDGDMYFYGTMTGDVTMTINTVADIIMKNNALKGWSTQENWLRLTSDEVKRAFVEELWALIAKGKLKMPPTGQRFTFSQIKDAMTTSYAPGRKGKVMLDCKA